MTFGITQVIFSYFSALLISGSFLIVSTDYTKGINLIDSAALHYFRIIYGEDMNISSIDTRNIQMTYIRQEVDIEWPHQNRAYRFHFNSKKMMKKSNFYQNNQWAEVIRTATVCLVPGRAVSSDEGYSTGWDMKGSKVPYGCWFLRLSGSGIFVNVGKTIIARTRKELMK
eukprot:gene16849-34982_t